MFAIDNALALNALGGLAIGLVGGLITSKVAVSKGYGQIPFFVLGFLCLVPALVIVAILPHKR